MYESLLYLRQTWYSRINHNWLWNIFLHGLFLDNINATKLLWYQLSSRCCITFRTIEKKSQWISERLIFRFSTNNNLSLCIFMQLQQILNCSRQLFKTDHVMSKKTNKEVWTPWRVKRNHHTCEAWDKNIQVLGTKRILLWSCVCGKRHLNQNVVQSPYDLC